jgi:hypothetical protein
MATVKMIEKITDNPIFVDNLLMQDTHFHFINLYTLKFK